MIVAKPNLCQQKIRNIGGVQVKWDINPNFEWTNPYLDTAGLISESGAFKLSYYLADVALAVFWIALLHFSPKSL